MRRYKFSLEAVRTVRRHEERLIEVELAAALRKRVEMISAISESREAEHQLYEWMSDERRAATELEYVARYGALHRQRITDLEVAVAHHDESIARIRERLMEAAARRRMMDALDEKEQAEHRRESLRLEIQHLDDIGGRRSRGREVNA